MKMPATKSVLTAVILLVGIGVVSYSALTVVRITRQLPETAAIKLPEISKSTLEAIRSREQTVQDINFENEQTGVRRNPFVPS